MRAIRVIKIILLFSFALQSQDVLKTRKGGGVEADGYEFTQPFGQLGSKNIPAWKIHADSGLVKVISGIVARLDSINTTVSRADSLFFRYSTPLSPAAKLNLMPTDPQSFSHIGSPGYGYAYGNIQRLESESSHHTSRHTINAKDYPDLVALGKAITDSGDSLIYVYVPAGLYEMPSAPMSVYGNKDVFIEFAPNAIICPRGDWPSTVFEVTTDGDVVEGDTTITFSSADADRNSIVVGMAFMARAQGASGSISNTVWNEDHYTVTSYNTSTRVATFWPPFDGSPEKGNIGFTSSFGYESNPYLPRGTGMQDTLYSGGSVEFGGVSLFFAARGVRLKLSGGIWTARPWGTTTERPVGSGGRAPINSVSSVGVVVENTFVLNALHDGIILQNSEDYIVFRENLFHNIEGSAMHIGGRGKQTMISDNVTYRCGTGIFSSLDLEKVFVLGNLFVENQSITETVYANYGSYSGLVGDHQTIVSGNYFDGGISAIDVGYQSGRLDFSHNIVVNMITNGVSVGAGTDPDTDTPRATFMVDISFNQIAFNGRNGIMIDNLEGGRVIGNQVYNNGTNIGNAAAERSGIRVESDSVESVMVINNYAFNLPDSGSLGDALYNQPNTVPKSQRYGIYVDGTDETNTYRDNHAWLNQTANFSITTALPSGSEFRYGAVTWQPGTTRYRSSDNTLHIWTGSSWVEM